MVKQIHEQVELIKAHLDRGNIDLDFISGHAAHLAWLADFLKTEEAEATERQREFIRLVKG